MTNADFLQGYAHQIVRKDIGNKLEIHRKKYHKISAVGIHETINQKIDLTVLKLEEKPEYEISLKVHDDELEFRIRGIDDTELNDLYKQLNKYFKNKK